jgi:NAD(P)-dependent dehydrogenase (short-subunit alcohol dehydrogenase family)
MGRLDGKVALVTGNVPLCLQFTAMLTTAGGGSGFGAGISQAFAAEGAKVLVCDVNEDGGNATVQSNASAMAFHKMDVTKAIDWKSAVDAAIQKFGKCDVLVNNAGTRRHGAKLLCLGHWHFVSNPSSA